MLEETEMPISFEGESGRLCPEAGVYYCPEHPEFKEHFDINDEFPVCLGNEQSEETSHLTTWVLIGQQDDP